MLFCRKVNLSRLRNSSVQPGITINLWESLKGYATKNYASSSDDEKEPKKKQHGERKKEESKSDPNESAAQRLNRLLASMHTDDINMIKAPSPTNAESLARPSDFAKKRKEAAKEHAKDKDIFVAAKRVAASMATNEHQQKQTESELLAKLLGHDVNEAGEESANKSKGKGDSPSEELSLSELIVGMKIDRRREGRGDHEFSRSEFVRKTLAARHRPDYDDAQQRSRRTAGRQGSTGTGSQVKRAPESYTGSVNLFGCQPLGIFKQAEATSLQDSPDMLATWSHLHEHNLRLQVTHPPRNYFEKMARWTEQGKVWRFPIDNEQDWSFEEKDVDFSDHIFLEQHLEGWCPTKGPIRHYMELVCVGLSKNPYITAKEKKEHILWYRDYFEKKKEILKEVMGKERLGSGAGEAKQDQPSG